MIPKNLPILFAAGSEDPVGTSEKAFVKYMKNTGRQG